MHETRSPQFIGYIDKVARGNDGAAVRGWIVCLDESRGHPRYQAGGTEFATDMQREDVAEWYRTTEQSYLESGFDIIVPAAGPRLEISATVGDTEFPLFDLEVPLRDTSMPMTMQMTPEQRDWFHHMHVEWFQVMRPFVGFQIGPLFPPLRLPRSERLEGCVLLTSREEILRRLPKGGICAEIGTQEGTFAEKMLAIVQPEQLHLFDLDDGPLRARETDLLTRVEVELHLGDSSTMLAAFPDNYFDWIYIDGDHSYGGVTRDIRVARTKVKVGGLLIFNDFTLWSPAECCDYGVPYAVCELSEQYGFNFVYFALHPHLYNDVALRRPATGRRADLSGSL